MNLTLKNIRYFKGFPQDDKCFMCGKNDDKPCVLVGVDGTQKDKIEEAKPVHVECLANSQNWRINREVGVIYGRKSTI